MMNGQYKAEQAAKEQRRYAILRQQGYVKVTGKDGKTTLRSLINERGDK